MSIIQLKNIYFNVYSIAKKIVLIYSVFLYPSSKGPVFGEGMFCSQVDEMYREYLQ